MVARSALEPARGAAHGIGIALIDTGLPEWQTLATAAEARGLEVQLVDPQQDGWQQAAAALQGRYDISTIHVLGHGGLGQAQLGTARLNPDNLDDYREALGTLGNALAEDGDLVLYGCRVTSDGTGEQFIHDIAQLTGADVAASVAASGDITGGRDKDGDWTLALSVNLRPYTPSWVNAGFRAATAATAGPEPAGLDQQAHGTQRPCRSPDRIRAEPVDPSDAAAGRHGGQVDTGSGAGS